MAIKSMFSLTCFKKAFTPIFGLSVLAFIVCLIFVRLGFWQLSRAQEKNTMLTMQKTQINHSPLNIQESLEQPRQYQPVQVSGTYLEHVFLHDNQHHQHQIGFHVLSPLLLDDGKVALIDRGWVPASKSRAELPAIFVPQKMQTILGTAYYPSKNKLILGPAIERTIDNQTVVEWLDIKSIGHFLHYPTYPYIIRLEKEQPHGFTRDWKVVSMPPEKHMAYAIQWFAMALVLAIIWLSLTIKKYHDK